MARTDAGESGRLQDQHNLAEARSRGFPMRYANTAHHLQEQAKYAGLNDCEPCRRWERFDSFSARKLDGGAIEVLFKRDGKAVGREVSRLNGRAEVAHVGVPNGLANQKKEDTWKRTIDTIRSSEG